MKKSNNLPSHSSISMKVNVCVVTFPLERAGLTPLSNLAKLLSRLADRVYVVSGGLALENLKSDAKIQKMEVVHKVNSRIFMRVINYIRTQLKILSYVVMISRKVDLFVFFIGGEGLLAPMLALKLLRSKVVLMPGGISVRGYLARKDPLSKFMTFLVGLNFNLADKLIMYSSMLTREAGLAKHQSKLIITHRHFVDFSTFTLKKKIDDRPNVVGYMGRLSEEKGILNFVSAMPRVLKNRADIRFVICGKGSLAQKIESILRAERLNAFVRLTEWVPLEEVPKYLNELRLLVLPSLTEGLPNILLEAMACGTPVLAAPVGAIPDLIKDGENGFLLSSNDPQRIAERLIELLDKPVLLSRISSNACRFVNKNFEYEETLKSWRTILTSLI